MSRATRDLAPPSESASEDCGVMCTLLKELLEGHLKGVKEHIDDVRDRENEIGGDHDIGSDSDEGFDVNNSTHTTKVLDDGSVVHINKTTVSDTDEDGNSFFFHKSVIHTISDGNDEDDAVIEEESLSGTPEVVEDEVVADTENLEVEEKLGGVELAGVDDGLMQ